jgi:prepilin-type processing-associated H-X9-DG protein
VRGWLDYTSSADNINTDFLIGFHNPISNGTCGHLGPYLNGSAAFKCPSDSSQIQLFGRALSRVRSVSMNNWMGGSAYNIQNFRVFKNQSDLTGLAPSQAWVIMDEREDSINDGWFAVDMINNLVNFPASYHGGGGNLAFADGRVENHQWQDARTNPELIEGYLLPLNVPSPDNVDLDWLRARTTVAEAD